MTIPLTDLVLSVLPANVHLNFRNDVAALPGETMLQQYQFLFREYTYIFIAEINEIQEEFLFLVHFVSEKLLDSFGGRDAEIGAR